MTTRGEYRNDAATARDYLSDYMGFDVVAARGAYDGVPMNREAAERFVQAYVDGLDGDDQWSPYPFTWDQLVDEIVTWVNEDADA